ncbi:hypothetical protein B484DRAFT_434549, partial [Ochromonadaceae sp. CCMP2298]
KVDLTASIRNILRNYPEGTAVLKELVQNADDAGASTVIFYLDYRTHPSSALADPALSGFQGPSLLVYNDAVFTPEDLLSIQRIGDSLKKVEDSRAKIGRFGIGFNAVYHWTDLPSFVSNNCLVMLDPQARFLPNVNPNNPGKMVDWLGSPVVSQFPDQFKPYEIAEVNWSKPFKGTLFRLPLRTPEQAQSSKLSKRALSVQEAATLLQALQAEASAMLLFLKSVTKIEIREWREGAGERSLFSCSAAVSAEAVASRCLVGDRRRLQKCADVAYSRPADYTLNILCRDTTLGAVGAGAGAGVEYTETWEICNQLGGRGANAIAAHPDNAQLRLVPWAGVAACVAVQSATATHLVGGGQGLAAREGLAYCFLPLPVRTGLPVMINGFFELSSNRRDVWQQGADMTGDGRTRAMWNLALIREVVAPCYARLLMRVRDSMAFSAHYQHLWPAYQYRPSTGLSQGEGEEALVGVAAPWDEAVRETLKLIRSTKLLRVSTLASAATDSAPDRGLGSFFSMGRRKSEEGAWISCAEAVLLPKKGTLLTDPEEVSLADYLLSSQAPLVVCSERLRRTLIDSRTVTATATPQFVRDLLRSEATRSNGNGNSGNGHSNGNNGSNGKSRAPAPAKCRFLLRYCLSDLPSGEACPQLDLLPLLPLRNDTTAAVRVYSLQQVEAIDQVAGMGFSLSQAVAVLSRTNFDTAGALEELTSGSSPTPSSAPTSTSAPTSSVLLLLDDETLEVFASASALLLDRRYIAPNEADFLTHPALQRHSNIRTFQPPFIKDLLRHILPPGAFTGQKLHSSELASVPQIGAFLRKFWSYAATRSQVVAAIAEGPALIPGFDRFLDFQMAVRASSGGSGDSGSNGSAGSKGAGGPFCLFPLSRMSNLIAQQRDDVSLPEGLLCTLSTLGVALVDPAVFGEPGTPSAGPQTNGTGVRQVGAGQAEIGQGQGQVRVAVTMTSAFWSYVHAPTRSGVIAALDFVSRDAGVHVFQQLSEEQVRELRLYLASAEPVRALSEGECNVLRRLPLFPSRAFNADREGGAGSTGGEGAGAGEEPAVQYVAIGDRFTQPSFFGAKAPIGAFTTLVDFSHIPPALLPPHYLLHGGGSDLELLAQLKVPAVSRATFYSTQILPRAAELYARFPDQMLALLVRMLGEVGALVEEDRDFVSNLRNVAFVPNNLPNRGDGGGSNGDGQAQEQQLRRPCELFDPTDTELASLLDGQFFPCKAFHSALVVLRQAGLQRSLNWQGVVACARSIASTPDHGPTNGPTKLSRASSLLRFLDKNMDDLIRPPKQESQQAQAGWGFNFASLFGPTGATGGGAGAGGQEVKSQPDAYYIDQLRYVSWLPVAQTPLHPSMPGFGSSEEGDTQTQGQGAQGQGAQGGALELSICAAPVDTAPAESGWLCSEGRRLVTLQVGCPALRRALGWEDPLPVGVIARQLRALSSLYLERFVGDAGTGADAGDTGTGTDAQARSTGQGQTKEAQEVREQLTELIPQLYQRLNGWAGSGGAAEMVAVLAHCPWIWVGRTFVSVDRVALTSTINAAPYLYQLPQDLQVYVQLMGAFQVKRTFSPRDYVEGLRQMALESR